MMLCEAQFSDLPVGYLKHAPPQFHHLNRRLSACQLENAEALWPPRRRGGGRLRQSAPQEQRRCQFPNRDFRCTFSTSKAMPNDQLISAAVSDGPRLCESIVKGSSNAIRKAAQQSPSLKRLVEISLMLYGKLTGRALSTCTKGIVRDRSSFTRTAPLPNYCRPRSINARRGTAAQPHQSGNRTSIPQSPLAAMTQPHRPPQRTKAPSHCSLHNSPRGIPSATAGHSQKYPTQSSLSPQAPAPQHHTPNSGT